MPYNIVVDMPTGEEPWTIHVFGREYTQLTSFTTNPHMLTRPYARRRPSPRMYQSWAGGRREEIRDSANTLIALEFWFYDDACIPSIGEGYDHHGIAYLRRLTQFSKWMANSHFEEDQHTNKDSWNPIHERMALYRLNQSPDRNGTSPS